MFVAALVVVSFKIFCRGGRRIGPKMSGISINKAIKIFINGNALTIS